MIRTFIQFWILFVLLLILGTHETTAQDTTDSLQVIDFILCKDVVEREPVDTVQAFSIADETAWVFVRISNPESLRTVYFKWYYQEQEYASIPSKVGVSKRWRTYSNISLQPGFWKVQLVNESNKVLKEIRFNVDS